MAEILPWLATTATVTAAFMTASNLGARITGYGFVVFLAGSLCWLAVGVTTGQSALLWTNTVLTVLNVFGIWRWLGRQAKVEDGTKAAAIHSEETEGESWFPASLLTHAEVVGSNGKVGTCVDAMIGCRSGRIAYVGVSAGGVAGVGETLHKLAWRDARIDGGELHARLSKHDFEELETFEKDQWPAR